MQYNRVIFENSRTQFHLNFFQDFFFFLYYAGRIRDKMQVVDKDMTRDRAQCRSGI